MTPTIDLTTRELMAFLDSSPSPYHAVAEAARLLSLAGFRELDESAPWHDAARGRCFVRRGGALVAWVTPDGADPTAPVHIIGAHTDSPNLRVKPRPDTGAAGWRQVAVEVYGGALLNSWLDRDLGIAGRLVLSSGEVALVRIDRPLLRVPQLAIHLDRDVNEKGVVLDRQAHLTPVWGVGVAREGDFVELIAHEAGRAPSEVRTWDLMLYDVTPAAVLGRDTELLASGRLDNLCSVYLALAALTRSTPTGVVPMVALFDHEEVGSESTTGAAGPLLETVLKRRHDATGASADELHRALSASMGVSSDMAHAVHPNYPERHEPNHRPVPNGGPVLKVNTQQRYASDALTEARWLAVCDDADVPCQVFVSRNNMPCGSTIGPITATRLGIPTVDVGCAQLSMHSARELMGARDPAMMAAAMVAFLETRDPR